MVTGSSLLGDAHAASRSAIKHAVSESLRIVDCDGVARFSALTRHSADCRTRPVGCNRPLGNELIVLNRLGSNRQGSGRKMAHRVFVPFEPRPDGIADHRHAFLDA